MASDLGYIRTIWAVAFLTAVLGCAEVAYGYFTGSSFLLKDGFEWSYGTVIYVISALSYGRTQKTASRAGALIALVLFVGGCQDALEMMASFTTHELEDTAGLRTSSVLSFLGAVLVGALLFRFRRSDDPVVEGSWLSARNDLITSGLDLTVTLSTSLVAAKWPRTAIDALGVVLAFQAAFVVARDAWALGTAPRLVP
jgi:Co/Zn/Cd efflux system component